ADRGPERRDLPRPLTDLPVCVPGGAHRRRCLDLFGGAQASGGVTTGSIVAGLAHGRVDAVLASGKRLLGGAFAAERRKDLFSEDLLDDVIFRDGWPLPVLDLVLLGQFV